MTNSQSHNPYVGPRPFEPEEKSLFFGREREISELQSLLTAHRTLLLYAASGAGKTSLLNAGLLPLMEQEGFEVLPVARVRGLIPGGVRPEDISNLYVFNTLMSWTEDETAHKTLPRRSLAEFLKTREHILDSERFSAPRLIIFDQFEELFTLYQQHWKQRADFFHQVAEALEQDPVLRVLFVMREDFLARLDPYVSVLPERLRTRYRLVRLGFEDACQAVERPLKGSGRSFADGVAARLVGELLKTKVQSVSGETVEAVGEYVEPVQLQIVCKNLWDSLPAEVTEITSGHLQSFGDVDEALKGFYENAVQKTTSEIDVKEEELRKWFASELITPAGTRGTVYRGEEDTAGIPNAAVDILENEHILRGDLRAGAHWYELTHDRLIEPIRNSNEIWLPDFEVEQARLHGRKKLRRYLYVGVTALVLLSILYYMWVLVVTSKHTISASSGPNGRILPTGEVQVSYGDSMPFEITPDTGYRIADVAVDGKSVGVRPSYVFKDVTGNHKIVASFAVDRYTIKASSGPNGSILPTGEVLVTPRNSMAFEIKPDTGYRIVDVAVDGKPVGVRPSYVFKDVTGNHTISASFAVDRYTIKASSGPNGSILPTGEVLVTPRNSMAFEIKPDTGYRIVDVAVDGKPVGVRSRYVFKDVTGNHTISASFAKVGALARYTIKASSGPNGSILPAIEVLVTPGDSMAFEIKPDTGYRIADVAVDGESVGAVSSYTLTGVSGDRTISATFEQLPLLERVGFNPQAKDLQLPNKPEFNPRSKITLEAWFNTDAIGKRQHISYKLYETLREPYYQYNLELRDTGTLYFALAIDGVRHIIDQAFSVSPKTWYHVAATYDGTWMRLYLNGREWEKPSRYVGTLNNYPTPLVIGAVNQTDNRFKGRLAEVRIWNVARTADQIRAAMLKTIPATEKDLVWSSSNYIMNIVRLRNQNSSKYLAVDASGTRDGDNVIIWDDIGQRDIRWHREPQRKDRYKIQNLNSGKYLAVAGAAATNGANVIQWRDVDQPDILWNFEQIDSSCYKIRNVNSGKYLALSGGAVTNGANVIQWEDLEQADIVWCLEKRQLTKK